MTSACQTTNLNLIPSQMPESTQQPIVLFFKLSDLKARFNWGHYIYMNIESQKRVIEINHALSGVHGQDMKISAIKINEARKQILKRLERKKKLSSIIHDELYAYLEKFPEEKMGLGQEFVKKKKAKMFEYEERCLYKTPSIGQDTKGFFKQGARKQLETTSAFFRYHLENMQSESSKDD